MTFIKFLIGLSPGLLLLAVLASLSSGVSAVGLIAFTMHLLKGGNSWLLPWQLAFASLCAVFILSRTAAWLVMAYIDGRTVTELRTRLIGQIVSAPLLRLEATGTSRLLTTLTSDVSTISSALPRMVLTCTSATLILSYLTYMSWISSFATLLVVAIIVMGASLYGLFGRASSRYFSQAGRAWDRFAQNLEGLISGIKQLKLNALRRNHFIGTELSENQRQFQKLRMHGLLMNTVAVNWAQLAFVAALGVLLLLFRAQEGQVTTNGLEFAFVFVCLMAPLETLMLTAGALRDASVAFERVRELGLLLPTVAASDGSISPPTTPSDWKRLRLEGVRFAYHTDPAFTVGPIDLVLDRQQIVFVVGGNGSGKSTFAKLLASLYLPDDGKIYVDNTCIDQTSLSWYQSQFSVVFDDAYLFSAMAESGKESKESTREILRVLGLDRLFCTGNEIATTKKSLSFGQKKRLALASALLEDRPIYVFDEWAAQQDEKSRNIFYEQVLHELRARGKLVIVITHDEGYYHLADRILRFQGGKLVC